jgi:hypothetical protein
VLEGIDLRVGGTELSKRLVAHELTIPSGEGGAPSLRLVLDLTADLPHAVSGPVAVTYRDANYIEFPGWREMVVQAGAGVSLLSSTAPSDDRSNELTSYGSALELAPSLSEATFTFDLLEAATASTGARDDATSGSEDSSPTAPRSPNVPALIAVIAGMVVALVVAANRSRRGPSIADRRR